MEFIDQIIEVKKGRRKPVYEHPLLEKVCGDTYGVMIYQEQVQKAAKLLAGYTLGGADLLRRAMGKKDAKEMAKQRDTFVARLRRRPTASTQELANQIFDKIEMFAGYGFNKSHSACYGHISYWTAYLKANHPVEFMAALLSNEIHNTDKIGAFVAECHRMGIEILPPDLNASQLRFAPEATPSGAKAIRYGLAAIKNVGEGAMAPVIAERDARGPFASLEDFANRLDSQGRQPADPRNPGQGRRARLDRRNARRHVRPARTGHRLRRVRPARPRRRPGLAVRHPRLRPPPATAATRREQVAEWPKDERLAHEKELLGFYVTGHPFDKFRDVIDSDRYRKFGLFDESGPVEPARTVPLRRHGAQRRFKTTKTGKPFGVLVVEDFTGNAEVMLWGETYVPARDAGLLEPGKAVRLRATVQVDDRTGARRLTG